MRNSFGVELFIIYFADCESVPIIKTLQKKEWNIFACSFFISSFLNKFHILFMSEFFIPCDEFDVMMQREKIADAVKE